MRLLEQPLNPIPNLNLPLNLSLYSAIAASSRAMIFSRARGVLTD
jgi:hypothetical protein